MYKIYDVTVSHDRVDYSFNHDAIFLGSNNVLRPDLLKRQLNPSPSEPLQWHLNIPEALFKDEHRNYALIVEIDPPYPGENHMAEILNVWGNSADEWTTLLLQLNYLNISTGNKFNFTTSKARNIVYTHAHAAGIVNSGEIVKKWWPLNPIRSNGIFLTPHDLKYFYDVIKAQNHGEFN